MTIIQQIDEIREVKGINKRKLCQQADITPEYYSKLINSKSQPSIVILNKLAEAIGYKIRLTYD